MFVFECVHLCVVIAESFHLGTLGLLVHFVLNHPERYQVLLRLMKMRSQRQEEALIIATRNSVHSPLIKIYMEEHAKCRQSISCPSCLIQTSANSSTRHKYKGEQASLTPLLMRYLYSGKSESVV